MTKLTNVMKLMVTQKNYHLIKIIKGDKHMKWNVYRYNFNNKEIEVFNIFDHISFINSVKEILKKYRDKTYQDKTEFSEELRKELLYYFWSKCEYEVIITSFPVYINQEELERINNSDRKYKINIEPDVGVKVDIYSQVMNNFEVFVDYVWNNKDEI